MEWVHQENNKFYLAIYHSLWYNVNILDNGSDFVLLKRIIKEAKDCNDLYRSEPKYPNKKLRVSLPLPPSVNSMYAPTKHGGKRLTSKAKQYIITSQALIHQAIDEQRWVIQDVATWYYADLVVFMPDRIIRDSHNLLKLLLDVMQDIVFDNDYYVMPRIQSVELDVENPRVELSIVPQTKNNRTKGLKIAGCSCE